MIKHDHITALLDMSTIRGKGRPRHNQWGTYTDPKDRLYEAEIREKFMEQCGDGFRYFEGPVHLRMEFTRPLPKSYPKKRNGEQDTAKPDADNMAKSVMDALTGVAWRDDCQVTLICAEKKPRYHGAPYTIFIDITYWKED